jgi:hypothetical protein
MEMGELVGKASGRTFSVRSTYISDLRWSSLSVASSNCLKMSTRPPFEALKSGLPMSVFATTGFRHWNMEIRISIVGSYDHTVGGEEELLTK